MLKRERRRTRILSPLGSSARPHRHKPEERRRFASASESSEGEDDVDKSRTLTRKSAIWSSSNQSTSRSFLTENAGQFSGPSVSLILLDGAACTVPVFATSCFVPFLPMFLFFLLDAVLVVAEGVSLRIRVGSKSGQVAAALVEPSLSISRQNNMAPFPFPFTFTMEPFWVDQKP